MIKARELYEEGEGGDMALDWTETDDDMLWTRSLVKQVLRLPWSSIACLLASSRYFYSMLRNLECSGAPIDSARLWGYVRGTHTLASFPPRGRLPLQESVAGMTSAKAESNDDDSPISITFLQGIGRDRYESRTTLAVLRHTRRWKVPLYLLQV